MFKPPLITSLEEVARAPHCVRRLQLFGKTFSSNSFSMRECAELLPWCTRLRELSIGWLDWTELPRELASLESLRALIVLNTPVREFPSFLSRCPKLSTLTLRGTDITAIPDSLVDFRALRELDLGNNALTSFPEGMRSARRLRRLNLRDTPFVQEQRQPS